MSVKQPPQLSMDDLDTTIRTSLEILNNVAKNAKFQQEDQSQNTWDQTQPRWKNLLEKNDSSTIWKAINWNGTISENNTTQPEDGQFKLHFENLLNPNRNDASESDFEDSPHIPVLDNPFTLPEMDVALNQLKAGKSYTGLCPGLLIQLPITWLISFLTLFNMVF